MIPLVGIIDSGLSDDMLSSVKASRCFIGKGEGDAAQEDRIAHGSTLAKLILEQCPQASLLIAQVFEKERQTPVRCVVEAIEWLVECGAHVINMSFGLRAQSPALVSVCERASAKGVVLVASSPARGAVVYPASLPYCIAVSGDARCTANQHSWFCTIQSDFGAHPFAIPGTPVSGGGSSFACARIAGKSANYISDGFSSPARIRAALRSSATYLGPERRLT